MREYPRYVAGMALLPIFAATHRFWQWYAAATAPGKRTLSAHYDGTKKHDEARPLGVKLVRHFEGDREETIVGRHDY